MPAGVGPRGPLKNSCYHEDTKDFSPMNLAGQDEAPKRASLCSIPGEEGYAMAVLLVSMIIMAGLLTVVMPVWKQTAQREKEAELVFRGEQYARAIGLFQKKYASALPPNVELLVQEKFLRKKYKDPITNDDFVPLRQGQGTTPGATPGSGSQTAARPGQTASPLQSNPTTGRGATQATSGIAPGGAVVGGINGVASKSADKSIRLYKGRSHYNEWAFVFVASAQSPGIPGAPGAVGGTPIPNPPGRRGRGGTTVPSRRGAPDPGGVGAPGPPGGRGVPPVVPGTGLPQRSGR